MNYTTELIVNGETIDVKKLDDKTITALVAYYEGLK